MASQIAPPQYTTVIPTPEPTLIRSSYPHHNTGEIRHLCTLLPISHLAEVRDQFLPQQIMSTSPTRTQADYCHCAIAARPVAAAETVATESSLGMLKRGLTLPSLRLMKSRSTTTAAPLTTSSSPDWRTEKVEKFPHPSLLPLSPLPPLRSMRIAGSQRCGSGDDDMGDDPSSYSRYSPSSLFPPHKYGYDGKRGHHQYSQSDPTPLSSLVQKQLRSPPRAAVKGAMKGRKFGEI